MGDTDSLRAMAKEFEQQYAHYDGLLKKHNIDEELDDFDISRNHHFELFELNGEKYNELLTTKLIDGRKRFYLIKDDILFAPTGIVLEKDDYNWTYISRFLKDGFLHENVSFAYVEHFEVGDYATGTMKYRPAVKEYYLDGFKYTFEEFWEKQKDTPYGPGIVAMVYGEK